MSKRMLFLNIEVCEDDVETCALNDELSLLDYDIAFFNFTLKNIISFDSDEYRGLPLLSDSRSALLMRYLLYWRKQIRNASLVGKVIFIMMGGKEEVYVATGEKQHSGTGRNRKTTRIVEIANNLIGIPIELEFENMIGEGMRMVDSEDWFATFWSEFSEELIYCGTIQGADLTACAITKPGDHMVSGFTKNSEGGAIVLLPYLNVNADKFWVENEDTGEVERSEEGHQFSKRLISSLVKLESAIKSQEKESVAPSWTEGSMYLLVGEERETEKLLDTETQIRNLESDREQIALRLKDERLLKRLLYEKGTQLEPAIIAALNIIGFAAEGYTDPISEFDAVFESSEGRFLGEAEGKDNAAVNITKYRQLTLNLQEDLARDDVEVMAKGVLFGNAFRLKSPDERGEFFTKKCVQSAVTWQVSLVRTVDLFRVAKYCLENGDADFAMECRQRMLDGKGIVEFSRVPEEEMGEEVAISSTDPGDSESVD